VVVVVVVVAVGVGVGVVAVVVGVGMKPYLLIVLALTGCSLMPDATGVEHYHASHLTARPADEDSLDVLQGYVRWDVGQRCSTKLAIGARLRDRGFYGPTETTTLSTGCEWRTSREP